MKKILLFVVGILAICMLMASCKVVEPCPAYGNQQQSNIIKIENPNS